MTQRLTTLVFDLDGTLYVNRDLAREIHSAACRFVGMRFGIPVAEADRLIRETKAELTVRSGWESSLSEACLHLRVDLAALHGYFADTIDPTPLLQRDERVVGLLERLGCRFGLHVYTNNNRTLAVRILKALGLENRFSGLFTIEDTWRPKPDLESLKRLLNLIGVPPAATLFVGDRYDIDLRLPRSLGCRVFLSRSVDELLTLEHETGEEIP